MSSTAGWKQRTGPDAKATDGGPHRSRRRGRPFRHRPNLALTPALIVDTALQLTREQDLSRLTVQAVADALDVSRSPIYSCFRTGEALRGAVLDHLIERQLDADVPDGVSWDDKLRLFAYRIFEAYDTYPGMATELFRTGFPDTNAGRRAAERIVRILREAGCRSEQIQVLIHAVVALAVGSVMQIHGAREREARLETASAAEIEAAERRRGDTLPSEPLGRAHYDAALEVLIAGIAQTLPAPPGDRDPDEARAPGEHTADRSSASTTGRETSGETQ